MDSRRLGRKNLYVFRKNILPSDDNDVLHPPDDEHFFICHKTEIPSTIPAIFGKDVTSEPLAIPVTLEQAARSKLDLASHEFLTGDAVASNDPDLHSFEAPARRHVFIIDELKSV